MKRVLIVLCFGVALLGAGCANSVASVPSSETRPTMMAFDTPVTFTIGQSITFQDGTMLKLMAIGDSRCKPGVQCIWAGELSPDFIFYDVDQTSQEFMLGTIRMAQLTIKNHLISLKDATTDQVTITVSKK